MTHKDRKSRTIDSQCGGTNQPDGKKIPDSAFAFKKFIALPQGLKVKSGDTPDPTNPRRPLPVKAVPLNSFQSGVDTQQIGVSTTYVPSQLEPSEIIGSGGSVVSRGRSRRGSVSSTGSTGTPNGSISSIPSEVSYTPRYRKRSSSTPPDLGRQRSSPVDRRIGKVANQYYSGLINSWNNNNNDPYTNGNAWNEDGDDLGFYTIDQGADPLVYSVGQDFTGYPEDYPGNPHGYPDDRYNHEDAYLDSSDNTKVLENWQLHPSSNKSVGDDLTSSGHGSVMHPHYVTLPRGGSGQVIHQRQPLHQVQSMRPAMAHTNGTLPRGGALVVYRPTQGSKDVLIVGNGHTNQRDINGSQGNLYKSKVLSSSMPTLLDGNKKADKKFLKELKKREKEERKRLEKEEKRRLKEEKKIQKAFKKAHARTLPKSFGSYVNKPIESMYSRPKLSLSAVPIDYEDNPSRPQRLSAPAPTHSPPPPPPEPSVRTRSLYSSSPDLLRLEQVYGATIRGHHQHHRQPAPRPRSSISQGIYTVSSYSARTVVLQRGPEGYGFVLRGAKSQTNATGELDFCPTAEFPALQYLDSVDPGSRSDRAGLKSGDFLLEINGENVVRASHDRVVQLIRQAGDTLAMKVVTVQRPETADQWLQHQDGSMTLPVRGGKKAAPQPPQRNPHTSISLTKTQGKQIAEGMAELENDTELESTKRVINHAGTKKKSVRAPLPPDQLDKVLAENDKQEELTKEQKTASIRSSHSAKRVSCVELGGLETGGIHSSEKYMSPSEMRIKKYHQKKSSNGSVINMERSRSTSDLLDGKRNEPVYATPVAVPSVASKHKRTASGSVDVVDKYDYDGGDNVSLKSASSYGGSTGNLKTATSERPKAPPPPPPGGSTVPKRQAPAPPKNVEPVRPAKTELVTISTNKKVYASTNEIKSSQVNDQSDQSSFKPANQVRSADEPKIKIKSTVDVTTSHQRNASSVSKHSDSSHDDASEKHSVSFAEDRVNDNAQKFLQKHPNAQLLVTADVHMRKKKVSEPEPDYDVDSEGENNKARNSVTIISVGDKKTKTESAKQLTIKHSDIPSSHVSKKQEDVQIPPPPREPAPKPPTKTQPPLSPKAREPSPAPSPPRQASPARQPSPVRQATPPVEPPKEEVKEEVEELPVFAPPPPAPPAPPPPPPPLAQEASPSPKVGSRQTGDGPTTSLLPTGDILAAVQKRQTRLETEGPKLTAVQQKKQEPTDNQAAIIAAVARRRQQLEQTSDTDILDQIESRLHKTKKLQSAKLFFSENTSKKTETKAQELPKSKPPSTVISKSKPGFVTPSKTTPKVTPKEEKKVTPNVEMKVTSKVETKLTPKSETKVTSKVETKVETKKEIVNRKVTESSPMKPLFDSNVVGKVKVTEEKKVVTKQKSVESNKDEKKPTTTDFLAMAEKARQDWLQKKASSSSLSSGSPTHSTTTTTTARAKSEPPKNTVKETDSVQYSSKPTSPTPLTTSTQFFNTTDKPKVNGVVRKTSTSTPLKSSRDAELISRATSIRDRIASFEKNKKVDVTNGRMNSTSPKSPRYKVQGVTTDSSATETGKTTTSALPPPPEFGDVVHVDIIPPPSGYKHEDTDSVVSSVSTLSTLSDEHADSGYSLSKKNSYEDLIPPPPPGFDDNTDQGYDEMPAVIPPPPDFESNKNSNVVVKPVRMNKPFLSKAVDTWQCLDVLDWLDSLNMTPYKHSFQEHCIDGKKLAGLTRNDYIELGVTQVGHRMNLERSIKKAAMRNGSLS